MTFGKHPLSGEDGNPARIEEHALAPLHHATASSEQLDLLQKRIWNAHVLDIVPEGTARAVRRVIVENQEVPDPVIFTIDEAVELVAVDRRDFTLGEKVDERRDSRLDEVD